MGNDMFQKFLSTSSSLFHKIVISLRTANKCPIEGWVETLKADMNGGTHRIS